MHYLIEYQTFESKHQLNEAISEHLTANKYELNETDRDVLLAISRHAVKFPGAAHLKAATLAGIIGKSTITVRRSINKLVNLNVIEKRSFTRKVSGGFGANLLIVLPFGDNSQMITRQDAEKPVESTDEPSENESEPFNSFNLNQEHVLDTDLPKNALKNALPERLFNTISPHFNIDELYEIIGILFRSKASIDRNITLEGNEELYIESFNAAKYAYKRGKVKKFKSYLYSAWQTVTSQIKRKTVRGGMVDLFAELISEQ